jgi:hypothetical protein
MVRANASTFSATGTELNLTFEGSGVLEATINGIGVCVGVAVGNGVGDGVIVAVDVDRVAIVSVGRLCRVLVNAAATISKGSSMVGSMGGKGFKITKGD